MGTYIWAATLIGIFEAHALLDKIPPELFAYLGSRLTMTNVDNDTCKFRVSSLFIVRSSSYCRKYYSLIHKTVFWLFNGSCLVSH
ncbi:hypothetical protein BJ166DRAFT_274444 [Pestalotiopsis sp. NC0098]|nr:hypothetical protein BJ166DRAFT_274444 [Pestalotiopsis sp. NC0098]